MPPDLYRQYRENSADQVLFCDTAGSVRGTEAFGGCHQLPPCSWPRSRSFFAIVFEAVGSSQVVSLPFFVA